MPLSTLVILRRAILMGFLGIFWILRLQCFASPSQDDMGGNVSFGNYHSADKLSLSFCNRAQSATSTSIASVTPPQRTAFHHVIPRRHPREQHSRNPLDP